MIAAAFRLPFNSAANWMSAGCSPTAKLALCTYPGAAGIGGGGGGWGRWWRCSPHRAVPCTDLPCPLASPPAPYKGGSPSSAERSNITGDYESRPPISQHEVGWAL